MSEYEIGDRIIITVQHERIITDIDSHGGGTDYTYDRGLPAGGRIVHTHKAPNQPKKKRKPPASARQTCVNHPEVGAEYACARCRAGRANQCILLEL